MNQQTNIFEQIEKLKPYKNGLGQLLPWELAGYCKRCDLELAEDRICENCGYTEVTKGDR